MLRDLLLRAMVVSGAVVLLLTEVLSPFHLLKRAPLAAAWLVIGAGTVARLARRGPRVRFTRPSPAEGAIAAVIAGILGLVAVAAWRSAPNSYDAMAYHLPRVVYWAQSGSVAFFPTRYFTQISLPPLAEYTMLHTFLLTGGDRFVNLISWVAFAGAIAGVSAVTRELGGGRRAQWLAALFAATLPDAILYGSAAKNDMLLALWLVAVVYFTARRDWAFLGAALGLALATKSTAYVLAPPLALAVFAAQWRQGKRPPWRAACLAMAAGALLLNAPQYWRNFEFSGSPVGYDSPYGKGGPMRWANETFGWKPTVSNAVRHLSDQLGDRGERWNRAVYAAATRIHRALGIDPRDPATTFGWLAFRPPVLTAHEASANNRWHLLLLGAAAAFALRLAWKREAVWAIYAGGLLAGFVLLCGYLKWEASGVRFLLPLFLLGAPLGGLLLARMRPAAAVLVCLFLIEGTRMPLMKNWLRPLAGPQSVLRTPRERQYFMDMTGDAAWQPAAVDAVARSGCATVGLDVPGDRPEYPIEALLRARRPSARFAHTGVENQSSRYAAEFSPCAVVCVDCAGDAGRTARYRAIGPPIELDRSLLFLSGTR